MVACLKYRSRHFSLMELIEKLSHLLNGVSVAGEVTILFHISVIMLLGVMSWDILLRQLPLYELVTTDIWCDIVVARVLELQFIG